MNSAPSAFEPVFPSIVRDLPAEVYHSLDLMSSSRLKILDRGTPLHLSYELANPSEKEHFLIGNAWHTRVLEPMKYMDRYNVMPIFKTKTKDGRESDNQNTSEAKLLRDQFLVDNHGKEILDRSQFEIVAGMTIGVQRNPAAMRFISELPGENEVSMFGTIDGVNVRIRIDRLCTIDDEHALVDFKSTRGSAGPGVFQMEVWKLGYGIQAWIYTEVARQNGLNPKHFVFVAGEKKPPYASAVYRMDDYVLDLFAAKSHALIARYKQFTENRNAGYEGIVEIGVPGWAERELELIGSEEVSDGK